MPSEKQRSAARKNIRKAASCRKKETHDCALAQGNQGRTREAGSQGCKREAPEEGCVKQSVRKISAAGKTPW